MVKDSFQTDLERMKQEISQSIDKALEEKDDSHTVSCLREAWTTLDIVLDKYKQFKATK